MSNKIIYNVTVKVDIGAHLKWLNWMKRAHLSDMMATGLFLEYKICRLLGVDEEDGITYAVQYTLPNMDAYISYQAKYALRMQRDQNQHFEGKYVSFPTIMKVV